MKAVVIYESLTGNTRKAAGFIGAGLERRGVATTVANITAVPYQALAEADLVVVGTWTDGLVFVGQRPGRAGRLKKLPYITGKRCAVFCTYAVDAGNVLDKLVSMMEERGGDMIGGMLIKRDDLAGGADEFVDRVLSVVKA
jgi:flavorubredoxin